MPINANIDDRNVSLGHFGISPNVKVVTAAATLKPEETNVQAGSGAAAYNIPLAEPAECLNRMLSITMTAFATHAVTVVVAGGTNRALAAVGDYVLLYCNGRKWIELNYTVTG